MLHRQREVFLHPAAADPHLQGDFALAQPVEPVEPQRPRRARRQFGDGLLQQCGFLRLRQRIVGPWLRIGSAFSSALTAAFWMLCFLAHCLRISVRSVVLACTSSALSFSSSVLPNFSFHSPNPILRA